MHAEHIYPGLILLELQERIKQAHTTKNADWPTGNDRPICLAHITQTGHDKVDRLQTS